MATLIIFIFILSILILVHEFGHFIFAKRAGVRVEEFSLGFGTRIFKKKKGDTEYSIGTMPLGGYVKMSGDNLEAYKGKNYEYLSKPPGLRFQIIVAGSLLNYILGFLCFWLIFFVGYPRLTARVGELMDGYGAKEAGMLSRDKIIAIDGVKVTFWDEMQKIIQEKKPSSVVKISLLREGKEYNLSVTIKGKELIDPFGQKHSVGLMGITPDEEFIKVRYGPLKSFLLGLERTLDLTLMTYKGLWLTITGKLSLRESVNGPLGVYFITSKAVSLGMIAVLHLIAVLNISLCIFNLLPLPVLDGGHILLLGIEKIRGKYLSLKVERIINQVGFTFIIALALLVTYNDLLRLYGDKLYKFFK